MIWHFARHHEKSTGGDHAPTMNGERPLGEALAVRATIG